MCASPMFDEKQNSKKTKKGCTFFNKKKEAFIEKMVFIKLP